MEYKKISKDKLFFWVENPRIVELGNELTKEEEIINKLYEDEKCINLQKDIVKQKRVTEDLWVLQKNKKFLVYDGNRRLACLKRIDDNVDYMCRVYSNEKTILQDVFRKHAGEKDGVKQKQWGPLRRDRFSIQNNVGSVNYKKAYNFIINCEEELKSKYLYEIHYTDSVLKKEIIEYTTLDSILGNKYFKDFIEKEGYVFTKILINNYKNNNLDTRNGRSEKEFFEKFAIEDRNLIETLTHSEFDTRFGVELFPKSETKHPKENKDTGSEDKTPKDKDSADNGNNDTSNGNKTTKNKPLGSSNHKFLYLSNMQRPSIKDENLRKILELLKSHEITSKNYENKFIPLILMYRPLLESHIEYIIRELNKSNFKNKAQYHTLLSLKPSNSLVSKNSIKSIEEIGKSLGVIKKEDKLDLNICDKIVVSINEASHGRKYFTTLPELIEIDEYICKFIHHIYKIISKIGG